VNTLRSKIYAVFGAWLDNQSRITVALLVCALAVPALAQEVTAWKLDCGAGKREALSLRPEVRYRIGTQHYGFDLADSPRTSDRTCAADRPFFVSVAEPDGTYRATILIGNRHEAAVTTVKAEGRRLMIYRLSTRPGQFVKRSFVVHVRRPQIDELKNVRLKQREIGNLDWDEKLTLEFTGEHPGFKSIKIEAVHVPTVYLAGDSTVVDQDNEPWAAWGQMLPVFFDDHLVIANEAESGETIASFVSENRFDKIFSAIRPGDYLFMQFAHNDQKPGRGFVSIAEYQGLLRHYIAFARQHGATPMLVTSMNRRSFTEDGKINPSLGGYPDAMREVAREDRVSLIDLNAMSKTLFEAMGPDGTLKAFVHYPANSFAGQASELKDDTHFNSFGALELAKCVVEAASRQHLPMARHIRRDVEPFDPARPDSPSTWTLPPDPFLSTEKPHER
jgi:lysophospholipase L1-like esterase